MDTQETKVYTAILIAAAVLAVILLFFLFNMIRQQRRNYDLYRSKILAEVTTLEKERARMARDLHDELGPVLLSVKYHVNSFELNAPGDDVTLTKTNRILDEMISRTREISNDLLPDSLLRKGLLAAIDESNRKVQTQSGVVVDFYHDDISELEPQRQVHLFRIIQEIQHNTVRHAKAHRLVMQLRQQKGMIRLLTEDDGVGFNYPAEERDYSGLGLRNLLSRAEILGGAMYLETKAGAGTRYTFEFPI